jgi:ribonuclease Z
MSSPTAATLSLAGLQLLGTPPPLTAADAWRGRQVALLGEAGACTIGEVVALWEGRVELRLAAPAGSGNRLLLRDALSVHGELRSARPHRPPPETPPAAPQAQFLRDELSLTKAGSSGPVPVARIGSASAVLVNGVFGDPLLKLQVLHQRRNLLFDLGDPGRMAARVAHQVSDLFLSHTHADHIGGFMWFLRSRIGELPPCRCYGPPGIAAQIAGMVGGILWDRVAERAPRFEVREWHDDHLRCFSVVAGVGAAERLADLPLLEGVVWLEEGFRVRAARLDHRTPVLAYAWEPAARVRVRRERLEASGLRPGRWLQALKEAVLARRPGEVIVTPDGAAHRVAELQHRLLLVEPGGKLVYATDFADTPENRERLVALAAGAHSLFCEASFLLEDVAQARRTQHLTTRACAEIANAAGVAQLHPFHFSRRYMKRAADVYREIRCVCERTVVPAFRATEDSG